METLNFKKIDKEYVKKIDLMSNEHKSNILEFLNHNDAWMVDNKFIIGHKTLENKYKIIWCFLCSENQPTQNKRGDFFLKEEKVIVLEDFEPVKNRFEFPQEILLNYWFCPECQQTITALTPRFNFLDYYGDIKNVSI